MLSLDDVNKKLGLVKNRNTAEGCYKVFEGEAATINIIVISLVWHYILHKNYTDLAMMFEISSKLLQNLRNGHEYGKRGCNISANAVATLVEKTDIPEEVFLGKEGFLFTEGFERKLVQYRRLKFLERDYNKNLPQKVSVYLGGVFEGKELSDLKQRFAEMVAAHREGKVIPVQNTEYLDEKIKQLREELVTGLKDEYREIEKSDKDSSNYFRRLLCFFKYINRSYKDEKIVQDLGENLSHWNYERLNKLDTSILKEYRTAIQRQMVLLDAVLIDRPVSDDIER